MTHPATLLRNSWHAYFHNWKKWLITTLPLAILIAFAFAFGGFIEPESNIMKVVVFAIAMIVVIFVTRIYLTASILSANQSLNQQKLNVRESYKLAIRTFFPILWVSVLRFLIVLGGLCLLIIPGIIWALRYSVSTQVAIIEGKRGMDALKRSREITNGKLLETFINFGVMGGLIGYGTWVVMALVLAAITIIASLISFILPASAYNITYLIIGGIAVIAEAGILWLAIPFSPLTSTAIYKDFIAK